MLLTVSQFADEVLGVSPSYVSRLIKQGLPFTGGGKNGAKKIIDTHIAIPWLINHSKGGGGKKAAPENEDMDEAKLRLAVAQADKAGVEAEIAKANVMPVSDAETVILSVVGICAQQMDALGGRMAIELAGINDPAEIRARLMDETRAIRRAMQAQFEYHKAVASGSAEDDATADEDSEPMG